ncbi:C40 family peptidase [Cohnella sp.]|uniref:C40 family peptidase n=1 Tax=Cohnella sp. TaxID=1883426 RepID=UPI00356B2617
MNGKYIGKFMMICIMIVIGWLGSILVSPSKVSAATAESLELISYGKQYIGVNYKYGAASGIDYAFDCSSYTQYVFKQMGIELPRTSVSQSYIGEKVSKGYLSIGDLVFFRASGGGIGHVAIYAGDGKILHASSSKGVALSSMESGYWKKTYVTARRVL